MTLDAALRITIAAALSLGIGSPSRGQETQILLPAQSTAKAKELLQQAIQALGGSAYLSVRDATCTGRVSRFGHSGELIDYERFYDYVKLPDKDRTEYSKKRNIIEVYNGEKGWVLDKGGVSDAPQGAIDDFQAEQKKDLDHILRYRLSEPGMIFRYAGPDIVDLKEADWVELVDSDNRTIRIALAHATHLPLRKVVITRDPATQLRAKEVEYYSNYHPVDGVITPFQITRDRNHLKVFQVFYQACQYNTGLPDSLFTKQSLEERWSQVGKKKKR